MSGSRAGYGQRRPKYEWIENDPIREAVEDCGLTYGEIARRLGWMHHSDSPRGDVSRLRRRLGQTREGKGKRMTEHIRADIATEILLVIGRDPVDFDL